MDGEHEHARAMAGHEQKLEKAAFLGVTASPPPPALREQLKLAQGEGLIVDYVEKGSPADTAGIKQYDVLEKLGDQILIDTHQLAVLVRAHKAGEEIKLTVIHQGQPTSVTAKLAEKEVPSLDENNPWGMPPGPWTHEEHTARFTMPPFGPHGEGRFMAHESLPDGAQLEYSDNDSTLTLSRKGDVLHLLAKDKAGKVLFDGAVTTEKDRQAVPAPIREKLRQLEIPGLHGPGHEPTTKPSH